jgi:hypothetical protein
MSSTSADIWDEAFDETLACLSRQDVADCITSLSFSGPDSGANGTREWTFSPLLDSAVSFPRLRSLFIKPTQPQDHNQSLVCASGQILEEGRRHRALGAQDPAPERTDGAQPARTPSSSPCRCRS